MKHKNFFVTKPNINYTWVLLLITYLFVQAGCDKKQDPEFVADFSFDIKEENNVKFTNESTGEYYSLTWDFGNGQTETTTDKNETFTIYYPKAGDYKVSLRLTNYTGASNTKEKTVTIASDDLSLTVSFTAEIDPDNPNIVNLKNTTEGEYDSFRWVYRNLETVDEMEHQAYFPFAGTYDIELIVTKSNQDFSEKQSVTITQDDPNYTGLIWSDEFDYTGLPSPSNWNMETGGGGWGNNELQYYTNTESNAKVENGILTITARKETVGENQYTSARITTQNKFDFQIWSESKQG